MPCSSLAPASLPPADIAVLDENIELDGEAGVIFGSDLVKELRQKGFKGVTCILTGAHRDKVRTRPGLINSGRSSPLPAPLSLDRFIVIDAPISLSPSLAPAVPRLPR
eukprot:scaffold221845_cov29-Tisochrysis_lutea.AAC.4